MTQGEPAERDAPSKRKQEPRDVDPQETQEWIDALESTLAHAGVERAHFLLQQLVDRALVRVPTCPLTPPPRTSTASRPRAKPLRPATRPLSAASARSSAGMPWPWWCIPTGKARSWAATSPASPLPPPCTTWASTISSAPPLSSTARPGLHPGTLSARNLRARFSRRPPEREPTSTTSARRSGARASRPIRIPG